MSRDRVSQGGCNMISCTALIATVYQEGPHIRRWLDALAAQTAAPE